MAVELRVEHVSSVINDWADLLSRENDKTDWPLVTTASHRLGNVFGPHSVNLCVTDINKRCARFYSP